ncbi:hypothetical protein V1514DRAFT_317591 [Lipomyces japonicus]|uniref:uncharacterized protein n=1 Tax=Lipomyces japonicus TaxID=56871 RepID=UPI0034CF7316
MEKYEQDVSRLSSWIYFKNQKGRGSDSLIPVSGSLDPEQPADRNALSSKDDQPDHENDYETHSTSLIEQLGVSNTTVHRSSHTSFIERSLRDCDSHKGNSRHTENTNSVFRTTNTALPSVDSIIDSYSQNKSIQSSAQLVTESKSMLQPLGTKRKVIQSDEQPPNDSIEVSTEKRQKISEAGTLSQLEYVTVNSSGLGTKSKWKRRLSSVVIPDSQSSSSQSEASQNLKQSNLNDYSEEQGFFKAANASEPISTNSYSSLNSSYSSASTWNRLPIYQTDSKDAQKGVSSLESTTYRDSMKIGQGQYLNYKMTIPPDTPGVNKSSSQTFSAPKDCATKITLPEPTPQGPSRAPLYKAYDGPPFSTWSNVNIPYLGVSNLSPQSPVNSCTTSTASQNSEVQTPIYSASKYETWPRHTKPTSHVYGGLSASYSVSPSSSRTIVNHNRHQDLQYPLRSTSASNSGYNSSAVVYGDSRIEGYSHLTPSSRPPLSPSHPPLPSSFSSSSSTLSSPPLPPPLPPPPSLYRISFSSEKELQVTEPRQKGQESLRQQIVTNNASLQKRRTLNNISLTPIVLPLEANSSMGRSKSVDLNNAANMTARSELQYTNNAKILCSTDFSCSKCGISASLPSDHANLFNELKIKKEELEAYSQDYAEKLNLKNENESLSKEIGSIRDNNVALTKQIDDLERKIAVKNEILMDEVKMLRAQLSTYQTEKEELQRTVHSLNDKLAFHKQLLLSSKEKVEGETIHDGKPKLQVEEKITDPKASSFTKSVIDVVALKRNLKFTSRAPFPLNFNGHVSAAGSSYDTEPQLGRKHRTKSNFNSSNLKALHVHKEVRLGRPISDINIADLDRFAWIPKNTVPVLKDHALAFREGIIDSRTKRLKRGVPIFKIGHKIQGEPL